MAGWSHAPPKLDKPTYDADADGTVDDTEAVGGTAAADMATDAEVAATAAAHLAAFTHGDIATNKTHATGDGSDHADVATNTTHGGGDGSDHANVALADTHRAGSGSDHADVATNTTHSSGDGSDHADVATNTAHSGGDGSDHTDVATNTTHSGGSGSDHTDVATNSTHVAGDGSDHADVAANSAITAKAAQYDGGTAGYLPVHGASGWGEQQRATWEADLSGTYDWQANPTGTDPTSGLVASGDGADATTFEVGSSKISMDISASGADKSVLLTVAPAGLPDLHEVSSIYIELGIDLDDSANNFDTADDTFAVWLRNDSGAQTEYIFCKMDNAGGNIQLTLGRLVNNANTETAGLNITNPKNAGRLQVVDNVGHQYAQFFDTVGNNITSDGLVQTTQHARAGGGTELVLWWRPKDGGRTALDITSIKVAMR